MDVMNRIVVGAAVGCTAAIGSATSFLVNLSFVWAVIRLVRGDFPLTRVPQARALAFVMTLFFSVEMLCGLISYNGKPTLDEIIRNFVFLSFLPLYSRLSVSSRERVREALEAGAVIGAFAALVLSLFQLTVLHWRAEGGAGNAVPFAVASLVGYVVLWLGCMRADGRRRLLFATAICASGACVILSGTRALWPGLVLVPAVAGSIYRKHFLTRGFGRVAVVLLVSATCIGLLAANFVEKRIELAVADVTAAFSSDDYSGSFGRRLIIWRVGLELFEEAPILGQGPGNAKPLLEAGTAALGRELKYSHYHDVFLTYAVRDGILGVLVVLAMILAPLVLAARHERDETGTYGLAFLAGTETAFLLSGAIGIMFGHDILDSLFMITMTVGAYLVFGPTRAGSAGQGGPPA
jgi:O-antigen ligase